MRIKHKDWPILEDVKLGDKADFFKHYKNDGITVSYRDVINNKYKELITSSDIFYLSSKIKDSVIKSDGFLSNHTDFYEHDLSDAGVFLINHEGCRACIAYISNNLTNNVVRIEVYSIESMGSFNIGMYSIVDAEKNGTYKVYSSQQVQFPGLYNIEDAKQAIINSADILIKAIIFKKYAPIETVVLNKNKTKKSKLNGLKHMTDSDIDVTVIDSTWFTTLIKTNGSKVKGHFRLQPYGPGRTKKRLTWIKAHERKGYIRRAKKEVRGE